MLVPSEYVSPSQIEILLVIAAIAFTVRIVVTVESHPSAV